MKIFGPFPAATDWEIEFQIDDEAGKAMPLSGATVTAKIATLITTAQAMTIVDAAAGKVKLVVTDTQSAAWTDGLYQGDVNAVLSDTSVRKVNFAVRIRGVQ